MRIPAIAVALATATCLSVPSNAATLQSVTGEVLINSGAGYRPVTSGSEAKVGNIVMASPGARAWLVYPDKCTVLVNPGAVVTVRAESPCAGGYARASPDNTGAYYLGAAALGGMGFAIFYLTQRKDDGPASP